MQAVGPGQARAAALVHAQQRRHADLRRVSQGTCPALCIARSPAQTDNTKLLVSDTTAHVFVLDIETGVAVLSLNSSDESGAQRCACRGNVTLADGTPASQINCVSSHRTLSLAASAHETKHIQFYDLTSGAMQHRRGACDAGRRVRAVAGGASGRRRLH